MVYRRRYARFTSRTSRANIAFVTLVAGVALRALGAGVSGITFRALLTLRPLGAGVALRALGATNGFLLFFSKLIEIHGTRNALRPLRASWPNKRAIFKPVPDFLIQCVRIRNQLREQRNLAVGNHRISVLVYCLLHANKEACAGQQLVSVSIEPDFRRHFPRTGASLSREGVNNDTVHNMAGIEDDFPVRLYGGEHRIAVTGNDVRIPAIGKGNVHYPTGIPLLTHHPHRRITLAHIDGYRNSTVIQGYHLRFRNHNKSGTGILNPVPPFFN